MKIIVKNIKWDTDGETVDGLPDKVVIAELTPNMAELEDEISDYLSDTYGFCLYGFDYEIVNNTTKED